MSNERLAQGHRKVADSRNVDSTNGPGEGIR
jgi:hypothetical protein